MFAKPTQINARAMNLTGLIRNQAISGITKKIGKVNLIIRFLILLILRVCRTPQQQLPYGNPVACSNYRLA
jgi:hypothetical protein